MSSVGRINCLCLWPFVGPIIFEISGLLKNILKKHIHSVTNYLSFGLK